MSQATLRKIVQIRIVATTVATIVEEEDRLQAEVVEGERIRIRSLRVHPLCAIAATSRGTSRETVPTQWLRTNTRPRKEVCQVLNAKVYLIS